MPIDTLDILGSDQIGIHLASVGKILFHPRELPDVTLEQLESNLQLEMVPLSIGGSNLIGSLLAGNSKGLAVADIATQCTTLRPRRRFDHAADSKIMPALPTG